jgi:hypothetical protein
MGRAFGSNPDIDPYVLSLRRCSTHPLDAFVHPLVLGRPAACAEPVLRRNGRWRRCEAASQDRSAPAARYRDTRPATHW